MCTYKRGVPRRAAAAKNQTGKQDGAKSVGIVEFVRTRLRFEPDQRQCEVLESKAKQMILNCTRQWGKSTVAAAKAVHRAYSRPRSLILATSPTARQSGELLRKAADMVATLGIQPKGDGDNELSLLFPNGSRIVGLPGSEWTVRGFSAISLLLIDEASRVEDAMYKTLRPMLAVSNGDIWLMSTPCGKRGFFYEVWTHGGEEWTRIAAPATECPRIPKEFLAAERREMGSVWFRQEYMGEVVENGSELFGRNVVEEALDEEMEPLE